MKQNLSGPVAVILLVVIIVAVLAGGWWWMNREPTPIAGNNAKPPVGGKGTSGQQATF